MFIKLHRQNDEENHVDSHGPAGSPFGPFVSGAMQAVESTIENLALTDIPVLIAGETGTGKEIAALAIHERSRRRDARFMRLRCASLKPEDFDHLASLDEAEGEAMRQGTVFLDEIADLSPACQSRLLESFSRQDGGSETFQLAACVISTSCRNMEEAMQSGRFRRDLYYRLSGVCLWLPPLRQRKEDIAPLAKFFLDKYARLYGRPAPQISAALADRLNEHSWPGNVRELENTMKRLVALGGEPRALREFGEWPAEEASTRPVSIEALSLKQAARAASRRAERELILKVLSKTRWNRKKAAEELQISYKALLYKLKQIGFEGPAS